MLQMLETSSGQGSGKFQDKLANGALPVYRHRGTVFHAGTGVGVTFLARGLRVPTDWAGRQLLHKRMPSAGGST